MFLIKLAFTPLRIALFVVRIFGYTRFGLFLVGVALGLLFAPASGRELREKLSDRIQQLTEGTPSTA